MECAERETSKQINLINNTSFKTRIPTDLGFSRQYKNFDISHSFWGLMEAEKIHLLVTVGSVIFRLANPSGRKLKDGELDTVVTRAFKFASEEKRIIQILAQIATYQMTFVRRL